MTGLVLLSASVPSREIANAHTLFSLVMVAIFLPFTKKMASLMERLIPDRGVVPGEAKFLDESLLHLPDLAVDQAHRQVLEMGGLIKETMLDRIFPVLRYAGGQVFDGIAEAERATDELYKKISRYMTSVGNNFLSDKVMQKSIQVLYAANDLEHIGDIVMNIVQIGRKVKDEELQFSGQGLEELERMYRRIIGAYDAALKAFAEDDRTLASRVVKEHPEILRLEREMRYSHFDRMQGGNTKTVATSSVHLDLIEALLRIEGHAVNIAQGVMGIV
jgi:phosphate:Na+ symporter